MGNYFESIKKDVQSAIEKAMEDIFEQVEGSSIYSMALVTDSDFITAARKREEARKAWAEIEAQKKKAVGQ